MPQTSSRPSLPRCPYCQDKGQMSNVRCVMMINDWPIGELVGMYACDNRHEWEEVVKPLSIVMERACHPE